MATQGTALDEHHFHGGPFSGEFLDRAQLPDRAVSAGFWELNYERNGRKWIGQYVRDQGSAGGRDWDWEDA